MIASSSPRRTAVRCNEALPHPLSEEERELMTAAAARKIAELLDILAVDHARDGHARDTPARVARMLVDETLRGRFAAPPNLTAFDNGERYEGLIVTGPIEVRSTCAHHLMPISGFAILGILPAADGSIIGLSKYDRIVDHFAARLQVQEELGRQIERFITETTHPRGVAVRISAVHLCKTHRGVKASRSSRMTTTAFGGAFAADADLRRDFLAECAMIERDA